MSKCDKCGLKRKTENMGCYGGLLDGFPEMKGKNLCQPCKNNVIHISACNALKKPVCRPDWQYLTDKRYKYDVTKMNQAQNSDTAK